MHSEKIAVSSAAASASEASAVVPRCPMIAVSASAGSGSAASAPSAGTARRRISRSKGERSTPRLYDSRMLRPLCAVLALLAAAGCSPEEENVPVPVACTDTPEDVVLALRAAPRDVRLPGGTLISECVTRANTDAELQNLGIVLTTAAEE